MKKIIISFLILLSFQSMAQKRHNTPVHTFGENNRVKIVCLDTATTPEFTLYLDNKIVTDYTVEITDYEDSELSNITFDKINDYRKSKGLHKIKWDNNCYSAAKKYSSFLSHDIFFSGHRPTRKNNVGESIQKMLGDRMEVFCGKYGTGIENLVTYFNIDYTINENDIFNKWLLSPAHNEGMLEYDVDHGAVSVYSTVYTFTIGDKKFEYKKTQAVMEFIHKTRNYVYPISENVIISKNRIIKGNVVITSTKTSNEKKKESNPSMIKIKGKWYPQI